MADDKTIESSSENAKELVVDLLPEILKNDIHDNTSTSVEHTPVNFNENDQNDKINDDETDIINELNDDDTDKINKLNDDVTDRVNELNDDETDKINKLNNDVIDQINELNDGETDQVNELNNDDNCPNLSIYSATSIDFAKADELQEIPSEKDDNCPNFSIYSATSIDFTKPDDDPQEIPSDKCNSVHGEECDENLVQMTDDEIEDDVHNTHVVNNDEPHVEEDTENVQDAVNDISTKEQDEILRDTEIVGGDSEKETSKSLEIGKTKKVVTSLIPSRKVFLELYDDSDWEEWTNEKIDEEKPVANRKTSSEVDKLTEAISDFDEERGYTPCQDEQNKVAVANENLRKSYSSLGIGGLDTEMVSEEEGNIFTDDLLKLTAIRNIEPVVEDGEIIEKSKSQQSVTDTNDSPSLVEQITTKNKEERNDNKKSPPPETFKKVAGKDRNYRDKDKKKKSRSRSREKRNHRKKKDNNNMKKEKRKDLEWYDVRNMISEKNRIRGNKDEYGRERRSVRSRSDSRSRVSPGYKSSRKADSEREKRSRERPRIRSSYRRFNSSRSRSCSRSRSKSSSVENRRRKKQSRRVRQRSKSGGNMYVSRSLHRSKSRSPLKKTINSKRKRSPSYHRDWTPSWSSPNSRMSGSPNNNNNANSPSWTPPLRDLSAAKNLKVIVNNKDATKKKKDKKKKSDMRQKETEKIAKKRRRESVVEHPSKEVFASGDNILVSVSFNKNKTTTVDNVTLTQDRVFSKRKSKADDSRKNKSKTRDKSDKRSKRRRLDLLNRKPIAIIDLDKSPFKELTPSPRAIIVLTDSDDEKEESLLTREERIHKDLGSLREESQAGSPGYDSLAAFVNNTGPKTPPEPQGSFSLQLKPMPKLRNLNILYDLEEDMNEDNAEQNRGDTADNHVVDVLHIGPNTPPEPPNSPPSSPDAYDPFEPTKSPSQSPDILKSQNNQSDKQTTNDDKAVDGQNPKDISHLNGSVVEDNPTDNANTVEKVLAMLTQRYSTPEKGLCAIAQGDVGKVPFDVEAVVQNSGADPKLTSPENAKTGVTILSNVLLQPNMLNVLKTSTPDSLLVYTSGTPASTNPLLTLNASRSSLFNSAGNTVQNSTSTNKNKSQIRPSPIKSNPIKPMVKTAVIKPGIRSYNTTKIHKPLKYDGDNDIDSPYSPCSDDFDDLFEPPATDTSKPIKAHKTKSPIKKATDFDHLFSSPSYKPSIMTKNDKKLYSKKYKKSKSKTQVGVKIDDDQLKILDELPSSAVEMQVKDKFMKKLNRQERVVEEVKVVLKPHYAKRHINKEQYKDILRRAVPKICHNRSGEINPQRIHRLIEAYVKRARYTKKHASAQ